MTRPECTEAREVGPDLALGLLDGEARAEALDHVHRCPSCQAVVAEFAGVGDLLVQLAPEADPPAGFERRVLDAMRRDRRSRRRWVTAVAAVAAAAAIGAIAVVRIVDADRPAEQAAAPELRSAPMKDANGLRVGRVVATTGRPTGAAVTVDYAVPDGDYGLVVQSTAHSGDAVGTMSVRDGHGTWTGPVEVGVGDAAGEARIEMIDQQGNVVCSATFPT
jgi:hypothetical protein